VDWSEGEWSFRSVEAYLDTNCSTDSIIAGCPLATLVTTKLWVCLVRLGPWHGGVWVVYRSGPPASGAVGCPPLAPFPAMTCRRACRPAGSGRGQGLPLCRELMCREVGWARAVHTPRHFCGKRVSCTRRHKQRWLEAVGWQRKCKGRGAREGGVEWRLVRVAEGRSIGATSTARTFETTMAEATS
jgi:hypothetical protein